MVNKKYKKQKNKLKLWGNNKTDPGLFKWVNVMGESVQKREYSKF